MNQNTKNVIIKLKSFCFWSWKRTIRPEKKELLPKSHDLPQFRSHCHVNKDCISEILFCKFTYNQILVYSFTFFKEYKPKIGDSTKGIQNTGRGLSARVFEIQTQETDPPVEIYETFN